MLVANIKKIDKQLNIREDSDYHLVCQFKLILNSN